MFKLVKYSTKRIMFKKRPLPCNYFQAGNLWRYTMQRRHYQEKGVMVIVMEGSFGKSSVELVETFIISPKRPVRAHKYN